jgi:preprotein translocase subunit SecG
MKRRLKTRVTYIFCISFLLLSLYLNFLQQENGNTQQVGTGKNFVNVSEGDNVSNTSYSTTSEHIKTQNQQ